MNDVDFRPYEELVLERSSATDEFTLRTPWLVLKALARRIPNEVFDEIEKSINEKSGAAPEAVSRFLSYFQRHPIWYAQPRFDRDPRHLFTVYRREHLLKLSARGPVDPFYKRLEDVDAGRFRELAALALRQNHFVTLHCVRAMTPALLNAGSARAELAEFINSEVGHHRFLERSIEALGFDAQEVEVLGETKELLEVFERTASGNFLAFVTMIEFFERPAASKTHPLARQLRKRGFAESAAELEVHRRINLDGEHADVGFLLASSIPSIDEGAMLETSKLVAECSDVFLRWAEALTRSIDVAPS